VRVFATRIARKYPDSVAGIHVTSVVDPPGAADSFSLSPAGRAYIQQCEKWTRDEGAYESLQRTRPQTLAFGLSDSPVGLASWIVEKFYNWTDCSGDLTSIFPLEVLLDNIMIYWVTGTIGSSVRYYYEALHSDRACCPANTCRCQPLLWHSRKISSNLRSPGRTPHHSARRGSGGNAVRWRHTAGCALRDDHNRIGARTGPITVSGLSWSRVPWTRPRHRAVNQQPC
jgi:hypothetical protein